MTTLLPMLIALALPQEAAAQSTDLTCIDSYIVVQYGMQSKNFPERGFSGEIELETDCEGLTDGERRRLARRILEECHPEGFSGEACRHYRDDVNFTVQHVLDLSYPEAARVQLLSDDLPSAARLTTRMADGEVIRWRARVNEDLDLRARRARSGVVNFQEFLNLTCDADRVSRLAIADLDDDMMMTDAQVRQRADLACESEHNVATIDVSHIVLLEQ